MEPLNEGLAALIAAETASVQPPPTAKARHWAGVAAAFGPVAAAGPGPESAAPAAAAGGAAVKSGLALKIVGGTVVAGALAVAGWSAARPDPAPVLDPVRTAADASDGIQADPDPARTAAVAPNAEVVAVDPPSLGAGPAPAAGVPAAPAPASAPDPHRPRPRAVPVSPAAGLAEELAVVEAMRQAIERGAPAQALVLARRHRREFPQGALTPDRLDLEASAYCRQGNTAKGQQLAAQLQTRWPNAPVSDRLRADCLDGAR